MEQVLRLAESGLSVWLGLLLLVWLVLAFLLTNKRVKHMSLDVLGTRVSVSFDRVQDTTNKIQRKDT